MTNNVSDGDSYRPRINSYNILVLLAVGMTSINFGYAGNVIGITLGELKPLSHTSNKAMVADAKA